MSQVNRMIVSLLIGGSLICVGYATGQQSQTKQPMANQNPKQQQAQSTLLQQVDQIRDQLAQLQAQVKDLQISIAELQAGQQTAVSSVGDTRAFRSLKCCTKIDRSMLRTVNLLQKS